MNRRSISKQLRVLSGTHAAASLDLAPGSHSLGARPECDISIVDWCFDPLTLSVAEDAVLARWSGRSEHALRLDDWTPVNFAGVILCIGPSTGDWPERATLMGSLIDVQAAVAPAAAARRVRRFDARVTAWMGTSLIAMVAAGWIATASSQPREVSAPSLPSQAAELQRALEVALGGRLHVTVVSGSLVVDGLVDDDRQAQRALQAIDALPAATKIVRRFSVASEVIESIRASAGLPGAHIDYRGNGVFTFGAVTPDVGATRAELDRIATDLAPTVRRIDAVLEEPAVAQPPLPAVLSALSTEDGISVMETRDGIKHIVLGPPASTTALCCSLNPNRIKP